MHTEKTKIVHFDEGFRFLGFDFWKKYMVLPEDRVRKYKDRIRHLSRRQQGKNLEETIRELNEVDRKSTRLNSSHVAISYAVFCLKKKNTKTNSNNVIISSMLAVSRTKGPTTRV